MQRDTPTSTSPRILLSDLIGQLPPHVARFPYIQRLRRGVRDGAIEAAYTPERFALQEPARTIRQMVILKTAAFEAWHVQMLAAAKPAGTARPVRTPTAELLVGDNWEHEVRRTREEMLRRQENGAALGRTGAGGASRAAGQRKPRTSRS